MTEMQTFWIKGTPTPQGSKKAFVINKRAVLVDASVDNKSWRRTVTNHIRADKNFKEIKGAVNVCLIFNMPKAQSNKKQQMTQKPDVDKLIRSVMDGMTDSGIIEDDSRVVSLSAQKIWATDNEPGVFIAIWPNPDTPTT